MTHVVAKPFNTSIRRMRVGTAVAETDDLAPHTFSDLKTRGFIKSDAPDVASAPAQKAPDASPQKRPFIARGEE